MQTETDTNPKSVKEALPPLWTKGFIAMLVTQFMVALNDNIFRWLIIPIGKCAAGWSDKQDAIRGIGSLAFLVPYLIFATYAGFMCDRFNRRKVVIWCKVAELLIMILGTMAIVTQSLVFMLITLFLMATQSAFFSPAKYGSLPNLAPKERISEANGFISMTTMIACIGGQVLGGALFVMTTLNPSDPTEGTGGMHHWYIWSSVILGVAMLGLISSFFIPNIEPADPSAKFPFNPFSQTVKDLKLLVQNKSIFWLAMASSFFWGLGALAQLNIDKFATEYLNVRQDWAMALLVALSAGLALGALLAAALSKGRIEFGLVPLGALAIVVFCFFLFLTPYVPREVATPHSFGFFFAVVGLLLLGLSAGMYDIPLMSAMQTRSPEEHRGRIMAALNFFSFASMAIFAAFQSLLGGLPLRTVEKIADDGSVETVNAGLDGAQIWLVCSIITIPVLIVTMRSFAIPLLRVLVTRWLRLTYGIKEYGVSNIPNEGPVLLVGNHVSFIDALIVYCASRRPVRFIADTNSLPKKNKLAQFVIRKTGVIQFNLGDRKSGVRMILEAQNALAKGEVVCIFPEGAITRTGQVRAFKQGFLAILKKAPDTPIVPFAISGLYGSRFAYAKPKGYKRRTPYRLTVSFGQPCSVKEMRDKGYGDAHICQNLMHTVQELLVDAIDYRKHPENVFLYTPARGAIRGLRIFGGKRRFGDSTGKDVTGKQALLQVLVLRRLLHRILPKDKYVGVLLPTSVAGTLVNAALSFDRRVPININYTFTNDVNNYCIQQVGVKTIIASSQLLAKLPKLDLNATILPLEDVAKKSIRTSDKLVGFIQSLLPTFLLERVLRLNTVKLSDVNTIIFTSGSTGLPKGAVLTNANISANAQSFAQSAMPKEDLSLFGVLPFFHSFGYTVTIWFPMYHPYACYYHYNPLDYRGVAATARKFQPDLMVATPTFMRTYQRKCSVEDFKSVYFPIIGAEKAPKNLYEDWKNKFGVSLNEGFGATELSPVLCHNIPECDAPDNITPYHKDFSIGTPGPSFVAKAIDMETGEEVPPNEPGMLVVKGNSVAEGYYNDPERTAQVFKDGWYITGDVAQFDEDNFVFITGRESRISKIGGEMAPHGFIEEKLMESIKALVKESENDSDSENQSYELVVTAVPDERKGEKLVVICHNLPVSPELIVKHALNEGVLPQLWIPAAVNFKEVDAIPVLGTGKLNLKGVKELALELYGMKK